MHIREHIVLLSTYGFQLADLHDSEIYLKELSVELLYHTVFKSDEKYKQDGENLIYACK